MTGAQYLLVWFGLISLTAVVMTVADKYKAQHGKWRISEKTLMLTGLLGGAFAMWITMKCIRHKTKHKKFMVGLPLEFALHIVILAGVFLLKNNGINI